jgi:hypothetical protein
MRALARRTAGRSGPRDTGRCRRGRPAKGSPPSRSDRGTPGRPCPRPGTAGHPATHPRPGTASRLGTLNRPATASHPGTGGRPGTASPPGTHNRPGAHRRLEAPGHREAHSRPEARRPQAHSPLEVRRRPAAFPGPEVPRRRGGARPPPGVSRLGTAPVAPALRGRSALRIRLLGRPPESASARRGTQPRRTRGPVQAEPRPWPRRPARGKTSGAGRPDGRSARSRGAPGRDLARPGAGPKWADRCGGWGRSGPLARPGEGRCGASPQRPGRRTRSTRPGSSPPGTPRPCTRPGQRAVPIRARGLTRPQNRATPSSRSAIRRLT